MIPVAQTETWNCHAACIASVLEMDIEEIPDINPKLSTEEWHDAWGKWLGSFGVKAYDVNFDLRDDIRGFTIGVVASQKFENTLHSIVCLNGEPMWDPQVENEPYGIEDVEVHTLLVPMFPNVLRPACATLNER